MSDIDLEEIEIVSFQTAERKPEEAEVEMVEVPAEEVRSRGQVHDGDGNEEGGEEGEEEGEEEEQEGEEEEGMGAEEYAEGGEGVGHEEEGDHAPQVVWRRPTGRGPVGKEWDTSIGAP